jgi:hypothetical protein
VVIISSSTAYAQKISNGPPPDPRTTPAYSMLIQKKVKVQAELERLLEEYGSEWPKAKTLQFEFDALRIEMKRMAEVTEPQVPKLTSGYGTLILRKVSLSTEIQTLSLEWGSDWPAIKDRQRELELLDKEIQKVMK